MRELAESPQVAQDEAALLGITHNTNIHDFLKRKHIRIPDDEADDSDDAGTSAETAAEDNTSN